MKLYITIAAHYVESRLPFLERVLKSVAAIPTQHTKVIIHTNDLSEAEADKIRATYANTGLDATIERVRNLTHPYFLTWAHKAHMPEFLKTDYTHFAYLEDDMEITQKTMDYWARTRKLFLTNGLNFIPAIHRVEYGFWGKPFSVDCTHTTPLDVGPKMTVENKTFVGLDEPYQGMFIMDRELVEEHIKSNSFRYETANPKFEIRERANLGNLFENVPPGFQHRALVPVDNFSDCWVHHNANNYVKTRYSPFGKLPVKVMFSPNYVPPTNYFRAVLKRLGKI